MGGALRLASSGFIIFKGQTGVRAGQLTPTPHCTNFDGEELSGGSKKDQMHTNFAIWEKCKSVEIKKRQRKALFSAPRGFWSREERQGNLLRDAQAKIIKKRNPIVRCKYPDSNKICGWSADTRRESFITLHKCFVCQKKKIPKEKVLNKNVETRYPQFFTGKHLLLDIFFCVRRYKYLFIYLYRFIFFLRENKKQRKF